MESKICGICLQERELIHFDKTKQNLSGYSYRCKDCRREYARKHHQILKERLDNDIETWNMRAVNKNDYCQMYSFLSKIGYNLQEDIHTQFLKKWNLESPKRRGKRQQNKYSYEDCCKKKSHFEGEIL